MWKRRQDRGDERGQILVIVAAGFSYSSPWWASSSTRAWASTSVDIFRTQLT